MERIQRKRTKGYKMPPNAVYVGRPTKLGNPFFVRDGLVHFQLNRYTSKIKWWDNRYYHGLLPMWSLIDNDVINKNIVNLYRRWLNGETKFGEEPSTWLPEAMIKPPPTKEEIIQFINGRDVACWCSLDKPCHVDVILEILKT